MSTTRFRARGGLAAQDAERDEARLLLAGDDLELEPGGGAHPGHHVGPVLRLADRARRHRADQRPVAAGQRRVAPQRGDEPLLHLPRDAAGLEDPLARADRVALGVDEVERAVGERPGQLQPDRVRAHVDGAEDPGVGSAGRGALREVGTEGQVSAHAGRSTRTGACASPSPSPPGRSSPPSRRESSTDTSARSPTWSRSGPRGGLKAPAWAVRDVLLRAFESDRISPYLAQRKVLHAEGCRDGGKDLPGCRKVWVYERYEPPLMSPRDYAFRMEVAVDDVDDGGDFELRWQLDDRHGAPPDGAVHMVRNTGAWEISPGRRRTRAASPTGSTSTRAAAWPAGSSTWRTSRRCPRSSRRSRRRPASSRRAGRTAESVRDRRATGRTPCGRWTTCASPSSGPGESGASSAGCSHAPATTSPSWPGGRTSRPSGPQGLRVHGPWGTHVVHPGRGGAPRPNWPRGLPSTRCSSA